MDRQQQLHQWLQAHHSDSIKSIQPLAGDASFRRYYRVYSQQGRTILVDADPKMEDTATFTRVHKYYVAMGIRVPRILAADETRGFLWLEDFGDTLLLTAVEQDPAKATSYYQQALSTLLRIQTQTTLHHSLPQYDERLIQTELGLFKNWYLIQYLKLDLTSRQHRRLQGLFDQLAVELQAQPQVTVHRDFQSRNLMILPDQTLGVIDFQDTLIGPISYDLTSLLCDAYLSWPSAFIDPLIRYFCQQHNLQLQTVYQWFWIATLQRHLKNLGIFARLSLRDNRPQYCQFMPRLLHYLAIACEQLPEFADVQQFLPNGARCKP